MNLTNYGPLINPQRRSARVDKFIDFSSWAFPAVAAVCSVSSGVTALYHLDAWAAGLGIAGGVVGALGVWFTNWASRIRDARLEEARSLGSLSLDTALDTQNRLPSNW
jgi:hypothetical protein